MITPLVDAINQTFNSSEVNYLGDMAIQLGDVQSRNGEFNLSRKLVFISDLKATQVQ